MPEYTLTTVPNDVRRRILSTLYENGSDRDIASVSSVSTMLRNNTSSELSQRWRRREEELQALRREFVTYMAWLEERITRYHDEDGTWSDEESEYYDGAQFPRFPFTQNNVASWEIVRRAIAQSSVLEGDDIHDDVTGPIDSHSHATLSWAIVKWCLLYEVTGKWSECNLFLESDFGWETPNSIPYFGISRDAFENILQGGPQNYHMQKYYALFCNGNTFLSPTERAYHADRSLRRRAVQRMLNLFYRKMHARLPVTISILTRWWRAEVEGREFHVRCFRKLNGNILRMLFLYVTTISERAHFQSMDDPANQHFK